MTKLSIIIPVYNCEQYIEQSIRSIQKQTIKELEVICVNDGSIDHSVEIIQQLQMEDERILLYNQKNQGSGSARNLGLDHAVGEYIAFLDADDYYLKADALESMYNVCKRHQVPVCGTCLRIERGGVTVLDKEFQSFIGASHNNDILLYDNYQFDYGYCGFIFERALICKNKIRFPLYRRFQDPVFMVRAMYAAEKFCFIDKALYVYRAPNVLLRFHINNVIDLLRGLSDNLQFAVEHNLMILFEHTVERIEYEYADIICHNLSSQSLALLLEIDRFIKANRVNLAETEDVEYTIRPLRMIFGSMKELEDLRRETLLHKLAACKRIYPYGAGKTCGDFLRYLRERGLIQKVGSILVTNPGDNPDKLQGISILPLQDYQMQDGDLIIITVVGIYQKEVISSLEERMISNYEVIGSFMNLE